MKVLLLDTNVVSILFRPQHSLYTSCLEATADYQWYISFMTRSELLLWPRLNSWGAPRSESLRKHIDLCTTLLPDEQTCERWVDVMAESRSSGRRLATADAWIAATAIQWEMPFVTADFRDFEHLSAIELIRIG